MKNILMIAYYYPPKGGAGVQRTTKFANYLSELGYNVHVLTVKESTAGLTDSTLKEEINPNIKVYRTDIKEVGLLNWALSISNRKSASTITSETNPQPIGKRGIRVAFRNTLKKAFLSTYNLMYVPDDKKGWIKFAVEKGLEVIKDKDIDMIYTTSAPYSTHIIGYKLSKIVKKKWVADFRDPWASNPFADHSFILQRIYNYLERKVVLRADKIISVSQPIIDDFIKNYPKEKPSKFEVITNGYDEEDFKELDLKLSEYNERFTILYNGSLYGKRSPSNILSSIESLIIEQKVDKNKIKIKFLGEVGSEHKQILQLFQNKYPDIVEHKDYVPHKESINELCKANALLLIIDEGIGSEGIFTGKIFEYIRTGKPILGVVPNGAAKNLILETNTGYVALPSNKNEIKDIIFKAYENFINNNRHFTPKWSIIEKYSRLNLTNKLVDTMKKIN